MGIMVYSLFWVMQDLYHRQYAGAELEGVANGESCFHVRAGLQGPSGCVMPKTGTAHPFLSP